MSVQSESIRARGGPDLHEGARVQIEAVGVVWSCRLANIMGSMLHLLIPRTVGTAGRIQSGETVTVAVYQTSGCWESVSTVRELVWGPPPILVIGPVGEWRQTGRRRAPRRPYKLHATLSFKNNMDYFGQTEDLSKDGVSLLLVGTREIPNNVQCCLTLRTHLDVWCEDLPIRAIRVKKWFRPTGRAIHIGATIDCLNAAQRKQWDACLSRISPEAD